MKNKNHALSAATLFCVILLISGPATAVEVSFQPRLETGAMYYAFESEPIEITTSLPGTSNSDFGFTQKQFEYADYLSFIGAGGTFFFGRLFLDFSGQYAFDGDDTAFIAYSSYDVDYLYSGDSAFLSNETDHAARFDRSDTAVALGYGFTRRLCLFAGYKWAGTQFKTMFQGTYSSVQYYFDSGSSVPLAGRSWGEADYKFVYQGPFMGVVNSWDCSHGDLLKGMFTANLALAYLEGKVVLERRYQYLSINSINGQPVAEVARRTEKGPVTRLNTAGDAWGMTMGFGWHGETALDGLTYSLGLSGYRYEFDADENGQSDINETALIFKIGLAYVF